MRKKILIIKDEIYLIKILNNTFDKDNFQVFYTQDGQEMK